MTMRKRFYNKGKAAELLPLVLINRTEIRGTTSLSAHWLNCKKLLGSNKFAQLKSFGKEKEPYTEQRTVFTCRLALICYMKHSQSLQWSRHKNVLKMIMECHSSGKLQLQISQRKIFFLGRRYGRTITHLSEYRRPLSGL